MKMFLTKEQAVALFQGWYLDPEQEDDWLRFDKGVMDTDDTVCYVYFRPHHITIPDTKKSYILYQFDRIEIQ